MALDTDPDPPWRSETECVVAQMRSQTLVPRRAVERVGRTARRALAVGASWGRDAIPLLDELTRRPAAPKSLTLLLAGARR
jgi:hypothetical protein